MDEAFAKKYRMKTLSELKKMDEGLDVIETGILPLDLAHGDIGPDGRVGLRARSIWEIVAPPNAGKSSILAKTIKTTQDRYGDESVVGLFAEAPDHNTYADKGVDLDNVLARCCFDPDLEVKKNLAEDWLESLLAYSKKPNVKLIFIDSIAALITTSQLFEGSGNNERDIQVSPVAALAKVFNNFVGRYMGQCHSAALVMTNHYKETLNTSNIPMPSSDQIMSPGGRGKEFLARRRTLLRAYKKYEDEERHSIDDTRSPDHIKTNFVMFKRKDGSPRSTVGMLSMIDGSYNNEEKLLEYAGFFGTRRKIKEGNKESSITISELDPKVASSGAWFYVGDEKFQGKDNAIQYLKDNPDIYEKLKYQVYARHNELMMDEFPDFSQMLDG